jgi:hypothetical protein
MKNVKGERTATAIVAVNPGRAPTNIPATKPTRAEAMLAKPATDRNPLIRFSIIV